MNKNLDYRTIGLSRQSELVTPTSLNRLTSFITLYGSELHSSGGVTKSHTHITTGSFKFLTP